MRTTSFVTNLVVGCNLPLSLSEHPSFRQFIHDVDPKFVLPSRRHISYNLIPAMWERKKTAIYDIMNTTRSVSLTVDIWTDRVMHSYLALTAHTFLKYTPQSYLLKFAAFDGSHTGVRIAEAMTAAIEEFGLDEKVTFIVSDNASNMKKAFDVMNAVRTMQEPSEECDNDQSEDSQFVFDDEELWQDLQTVDLAPVTEVIEHQCVTRLSCFAHTSELVVRDGVTKLPTATGVLAKVSKTANVVHQSAKFRAAFEEKFGSNCKSIPSTNATRWSSLHSQLKAVAQLDQTKLADVLREQSLHNLVLTQREHASLLELVEILDPFAEATDLCQGQSYTTIGCVVPCIVSLYKHLLHQEVHCKFHRPMVMALLESLRKRFSGLLSQLRIQIAAISTKKDGFAEDLYLIAPALDPSYSFIWLEEDHPGDDTTKTALKDYITGMYWTRDLHDTTVSVQI